MIQESVEDFRKRYKNTYVFLTLNGKETLVYYEQDHREEHDDEGEDEFSFWSPIYGSILVDADCAMGRLSFIFPEAGLYNINEECYEFNRNPARQWKRAPCQDNTSFTSPLKNIGLGIQNIILDHNSAQELFFPSYPNSIEEAIDNLKTMVALNGKFGISNSATKDLNKLLFWYKSEPIGYINPTEKTIEIHVKQLYQEVVDYVKKEAWTWRLINKCH